MKAVRQSGLQRFSCRQNQVWKESGHEGSIFKALELYRKLIKMDEKYAEKYGDIEERAAIIPELSIEIVPSDMQSKGMEKVNITNNSDKPITSINCECELYDENNTLIHSEISQIYQTVEPGATVESWAMFNSEAVAKRKSVKLKIVNATLT